MAETRGQKRKIKWLNMDVKVSGNYLSVAQPTTRRLARRGITGRRHRQSKAK